jgi:rhodanese-related sulfurtransferase
MSFLSKLFGGGNSDSGTVKGTHTVLNADEFKARMKGQKPLRLIDVRTPREFQAGHIKGAKNIDVMNPSSFDQQLGGMEKEAPVFVYCRSGQRSRNASKRMLKMGFSEVYDLKGGYMAWN